MKVKLTPYLRKHAMTVGIHAQYVPPDGPEPTYNDPLEEETYEVVRGLVHKYPNRALIKVSYRCAAHCRFCTRARQIGDPAGDLSSADIRAIAAYLKLHPEIDDVILSGGDPLYTPGITREVLEKVGRVPSVKVLRIGTRLPLQLPSALKKPALADLLKSIQTLSSTMPVFILLHVNHPAELGNEALEAIRILKGTGVILLSQTVFLRGINDTPEVLTDLFRSLFHSGVVPYYIYHCDAVTGMERFVVPLETEIHLMRTLHSRLSGIAVPRHVLDISGGKGKIPVNSGFWNAGSLSDFEGKVFPVPG